MRACACTFVSERSFSAEMARNAEDKDCAGAPLAEAYLVLVEHGVVIW